MFIGFAGCSAGFLMEEIFLTLLPGCSILSFSHAHAHDYSVEAPDFPHGAFLARLGSRLPSLPRLGFQPVCIDGRMYLPDSRAVHRKLGERRKTKATFMVALWEVLWGLGVY